MKHLLLLLFISTAAAAQEVETPQPRYNDSLITLQLTQSFAYWMGHSFRITTENRRVADILAAYIADGKKPDSIFTVTLQAKYVKDALEELLGSKILIAYKDYRSIILNEPSIPGYTSLANQIVAKASGTSTDKNTAIFLRDWFLSRTASMENLYLDQKNKVIEWSKH